MDRDDTDRVIRAFADFLNEVVAEARESGEGTTSLVTALSEHFGTVPGGLPVVKLEVENHQFVNLDVAIVTMVTGHGGGAVLIAAEAGRPAHDDDLATALGELLDAREHLTRALLGVPTP